jgi:hypothetical protein
MAEPVYRVPPNDVLNGTGFAIQSQTFLNHAKVKKIIRLTGYVLVPD